MIKTVFLDMDGVICNFRKGVHGAFYKFYDYTTLSDKWTFWDDWPDVTLDMVNVACDMKFWDHLEWTEDGRDILRTILNKFHVKQIYLLTDPVIGTGTASGKMMWIDRHIPVYLKHTIITQAPKHLLARSDTLLIDDKDENVDEFREAGGKAILINRPWNVGHKRANYTIEDFKNELEKYT